MVNKNTQGFTLIEVLIAMAIFAVIATLSYASLSKVTKTKEILEGQYNRFAQIQKAITVMERDFLQIVPRSIRNSSGSSEPAMAGSDTKVTFTRTGRTNLLLQPQSNMLRVRYALDGKMLKRETWAVLDQASGSTSESLDLLDSVEQFTLQYMGQNREWVSTWPSASAPAVSSSPSVNETSNGISTGAPTGVSISLESDLLPKFIRFDIKIKDFGLVTRILPGVG